jgi:hypothetical protein
MLPGVDDRPPPEQERTAPTSPESEREAAPTEDAGSAGRQPEAPPPASVPPRDAALPRAPWLQRLRAGLARRLEARGLGSAPLAAFALGPAAVGGVCLALAHHGLGAVFGLLAVAVAWLATARPTPPLGTAADAPGPLPSAFARVLAHATVPLLLGGAILDAAGSAAAGRGALATWALGILLLLPLVRAVAPTDRLAEGPLLWSFGERMSGLLFGPLLGHPTLGTFVVGCVASADLLLRLALLRPIRPGEAPLPAGLQGLFTPDGRPQPGVRLACQLALAVLVLVFVILGRTEGWRF